MSRFVLPPPTVRQMYHSNESLPTDTVTIDSPGASQVASNNIPFVSVSAAMTGRRPPTERVGKRKAEDEALPRNKESRLASSTVKSRAVAMFIDFEEGLDIMRKSEANRAAAQMKNRRVTQPTSGAATLQHSNKGKNAEMFACQSHIKALWRVVNPPKTRAPTPRVTAPSSHPRVWTGVRHRYFDRCSTANTQHCREKMSCWRHSLSLRKARTVL